MSSRTSNLSRLAWGTHSRLPFNWSTPGLWHSPSEKMVFPNSQRDHGCAVWSVVSFRAMRVRSFRSGRCVPRRLTERTHEEARVEGRSASYLAAASAPVRRQIVCSIPPYHDLALLVA